MKASAKECRMVRSFIIISTLCFLAWPCGAGAETAILVQPASNGGLLVSAGNLYGVTGGEIRLDYMTDGPAVAPGVVVLGNNTQASLMNSSDFTGTVIISITGRKPGNGYVNLARINLVDQNGNPGRIIPPYSAFFTKDGGGQEAARVEITNPAPTDKKPDETLTIDGKKMSTAEAAKKRQQELAARQPAAPESDTSARGPVTQDSDERTRESVVLVASPPQTPQMATSKPATPEFRRIEGVLDRFRSHEGAWNTDIIEQLFAPLNSHGFRQAPAVMIANGVAEVQVAVRSVTVDEAINCFIIRGGQVASVQMGEAGEWLLTIVPRQGALAVTVTVQTEQHIIEYPLTVAPPQELFDAAAASPALAEFVKAANRLARSTALKQYGRMQ